MLDEVLEPKGLGPGAAFSSKKARSTLFRPSDAWLARRSVPRIRRMQVLTHWHRSCIIKPVNARFASFVANSNVCLLLSDATEVRGRALPAGLMTVSLGVEHAAMKSP